MGVFSRLTDIVNSNIVHMLDKAEDPEKMVRLMIQEMEDTLVEVKSQTARVIADKKTLQRELNLLRDDENKWQQKAELAVSKERDDLALSALEEKNHKSDAIKICNQNLSVVETSLEKYREDIKVLDDKLIDARNRKKAIILRKQTATSQINVRNKINRANSDKALHKFDQYERKIDELEGEVEAFSTNRENDLEEEFNKLEQESKLDKELQKLKDKLKSGGGNE